MALIERPIFAFFSLGMHWCSLCEAEAKPGPDCRSSQAVLLVPGSDCVYEAPIWIGHYVLGHSDQPPPEFCQAVLSSPQPGSDEFRKALSAHIPSLSGMDVLEEFPFFVEWAEGAQQTLRPDPENGSPKRLIEKFIEMAGNAEPQKSRAQIIAEHGGLSTAACAWAGCENRALLGLAICVDHAYPRWPTNDAP